MDENDLLSTAEIKELSIRAVNELIAEAVSGQLSPNKELVEVIIGCLRTADQSCLRTLKWLLKQHDLELPGQA